MSMVIPERTERKYEPYPEYKDSGVEWLGEIPAHWEIKPLKRVLKVFNGSTPRSSEPEYWDGDIPWVTPEDLGELASVEISETRRYITQNGYESCGTNLVPAGSLILSTRAPIGHLAIATVSLCTNQGCRALVPRSDMRSRFSYYVLYAGRQKLISLGQGSTFMELGKSELETVVLPFPKTEEQQAIADFLDGETTRIDKLIEKKKKLIELLQEQRTALITHTVTRGLNPDAPMKGIGVEWMGEIPMQWELKKLKYVSKIVLGKMLESSDKGDHNKKPYLRAQNILWEKVDDSDVKEMWFSDYELIQYRIELNDLLVSEGGEVGRTAIWRNELEECYIQNSVHKVTMRKDNAPFYFLYQFLAHGQSGHFDAIVNRVSIAHLTREKLKEVYFLVPPSHEQQAIADYLDQETARIDNLVGRINQVIEKLHEYRTSLITAAVTGKIDVR